MIKQYFSNGKIFILKMKRGGALYADILPFMIKPSPKVVFLGCSVTGGERAPSALPPPPQCDISIFFETR